MDSYSLVISLGEYEYNSLRINEIKKKQTAK